MEHSQDSVKLRVSCSTLNCQLQYLENISGHINSKRKHGNHTQQTCKHKHITFTRYSVMREKEQIYFLKTTRMDERHVVCSL